RLLAHGELDRLVLDPLRGDRRLLAARGVDASSYAQSRARGDLRVEGVADCLPSSVSLVVRLRFSGVCSGACDLLADDCSPAALVEGWFQDEAPIGKAGFVEASVFRMLVKAGPDGLVAGEIANGAGVP